MREFEIRNYMIDKHGMVTFLVRMDLETYNEALENHIEHIKNDCFNDGFEAGQSPYPTEEELADMDDDRTEDHSQESDPGIV